MSQQENTVGGVGVVDVAGVQVTIAPLSQKEERLLWRRLRKGAEQDQSSTSLFERPAVKRLLTSLQSVPAAYVESIRELTRLAAAADEVTETRLFAFRGSPAGVALELFERGRKATPGLDLAGLQALITDINADDVFEEMMAIVEAGLPK